MTCNKKSKGGFLDCFRRSRSKTKDEKKGKVVRLPKANCNFVAVELGKLDENSHLATGDPTFCRGCNVVLSSVSKIASNAWKWCDDLFEIQIGA